MELTTYKVLTGLAYITLIIIATYVSWKKGEKVGSTFMLQYLRENKFMNDTEYNKFMRHVRIEKKIAEIKDVISEIDVPALQIMLETRLIEIAVDAEEQLGLDWSKLSKVTTIFAENAIPPFTGAGSLVPGLKIIEEADGTFTEDFSSLPIEQKPSQMYFQRLGSGGIGFSRQMMAFETTLDLLLKN